MRKVKFYWGGYLVMLIHVVALGYSLYIQDDSMSIVLGATMFYWVLLAWYLSMIGHLSEVLSRKSKQEKCLKEANAVIGKHSLKDTVNRILDRHKTESK